ncbi:MFS transporter [Sphingomonas jatrophae]|uniref:Predicted arabinose efflux permease, MFS family n=1 Tax=Sphingomonas jatrophae TaxID=1166337 RepID=A0A1I6KDB6_9SPHN|nr:MFS transporter [Sphingomonas jatrophae]SFR89295.1 Predicted arabinose efflux permease, MFS family [Sphingomonas jatrophae]
MSVAAEDASPRGGAGAWWMVAVLFAMYVFSWLDRLIVSMLVTPLKADLGLSDVQISMITSTSFAFFYALFGLPLGWAADRLSRRWLIFGGVLTWAAATIACGYARSFEALLIARIFVGAGEAALLPAAYSLIADAFPRDRLALPTSVFQMAGKVGSATAFGFGGLAIAFATARSGISLPLHGPAQPWQLVMMMVGLPGFLLAFLVFTFREPARRGVAPVQAGSGAFAGFLRENKRLILLMLVGTSALSICGYSMTNWVPALIERRYGLTPASYGLLLSVTNLVAAGSLVVSGSVVDRLYRGGMDDAHLRFYSWLIAGVFPIILLTFFAPSVWLFLVGYGIIQFITVPFMVYVSAIVGLLAPSDIRARLLAMFLFVFTLLGLGAGPAIVALLTDKVFANEAQLDRSLAIVVTAGAMTAFVAFRLALRHLAPAVARMRAIR